MIQVIGVKRVVIAVILLGVNLALAAGLTMVLEPKFAVENAAQVRLEREMRQMRADLSDIEGRLQMFRDNQVAYNKLKESGFFGDQDRITARKTLDRLRTEARLVSISYDIRAAEFVDHPKATEINHQMVSTKIKVTMRGHLDRDFYNFSKRVKDYFPGQTRLLSMNVQPDESVTTKNLLRLSKGESVSFVKGELEFEWRTLQPQKGALGGAK